LIRGAELRQEKYTISEIAEKTGLTRRTIRYYVQTGIIPSPEGKGGAARYTDEHLVMLQMIRILQSSHLKLEGIREAISGMTIEEMESVLDKVEYTGAEWNTDAVRNWLSGKSNVGDSAAGYRSGQDFGFSFADIGRKSSDKKNYDNNFLSKIGRDLTPKKEVYEKIEISEGIEIHFREDVPEATKQSVMQALARSGK